MSGTANCTTLIADNEADCTGTYTGLQADLGDQDDFFDGSQASLPMAINAGAGFDDVTGGSGSDTIHGDADDNYLNGGPGADSVYGDAGVDELDDLTGAGDSLSGGADADYFYLGSSGVGADTYDGGSGTDEIDYSGRTTAVTVDLSSAAPGAGVAGENDSVLAMENVDGSFTAANTLTGDGSDNNLYGGNGGNTLTGNAGNDGLYGGNGVDHLSGGNDVDYLVGGDGADTLNGDAGDDEIPACFRIARVRARAAC